ncbi:uroporphyrinogen-III synthase [Virgibacillus sp. 179-BFC.A HS]|uniref:Uroporphyrinogen-III synthase n=1 Tax=Tigheibacillus jepli TaxID=3035914 RepID=A0ABU5CGM6_9BACI|nr:uroporphyrinogen-III synthase [Virgibacillus sp. 179-BFC.A HS]MDY0405436.1 uroporphyrinogen-III synthase [Virgibacillus sp. 179-BFC.A HS]
MDFFTSANGVNYFYELMSTFQIPDSTLQHVKIAVVGHKTENALKKHGRAADFTPTIYDAEHMADEFLKKYGKIDNVLLIRGNLSRPTLPEQFLEANVAFEMAEVYQTKIAYGSKKALNEVLANQRCDFITFTSPSTVKAFMQLTNETIRNNIGCTCVCIGDTTKTEAVRSGFQSVLVPKQYTIEGMIACMENYLSQRNDL